MENKIKVELDLVELSDITEALALARGRYYSLCKDMNDSETKEYTKRLIDRYTLLLDRLVLLLQP